MMNAFIIAYMAITARQSGGGLGAQYLPRWLTWLPEVFFAAGFGFAAFQYGGWIAAALATAWSYIWMQTGHGTVLQWGRDPSQAAGRTQTLTPYVNVFALALNLPVGGVGYCRLFMAVKGFLIGLPVGGLPLAVLWPLAYEIGVRVKRHEVSELLSGAFSGISIVAFLLLKQL